MGMSHTHTASTQKPRPSTSPFNLVIIFIHGFTRAEIVRWVSESIRPFKVVADRGFKSLMKTGRPGYYLPTPQTVSRDVKRVFVKARQRIATMLQVCHFVYINCSL